MGEGFFPILFFKVTAIKIKIKFSGNTLDYNIKKYLMTFCINNPFLGALNGDPLYVNHISFNFL